MISETAIQTTSLDMFQDWLASADPTDECIYHVGYLPQDRTHQAVNDIAQLAYQAATEGGTILLYQHHLAESTPKRDPVIEYRAIRTTAK